MGETVTIQRTETGALVLVAGAVRATFTGDLATGEGRDALEELLQELFGADGLAAIRFLQEGNLT